MGVIEIPGEINELQDLCIVIQWNGLSVSKENYGQIPKAPKGESSAERDTQRAERKKEEEEGRGNGVRGGAPAKFLKSAF